MPAEHEAAALAVLDSGSSVDLILAGATYRSRLEFLADLREQSRSVPVVFLADHRDAESRLRGLAGGFYASPKLILYLNTRLIEFYELDRLIRSVPCPKVLAASQAYTRRELLSFNTVTRKCPLTDR